MPPSIPAVTIGLTVYNGERYLPQAIESCLGQSFGDFELLIQTIARPIPRPPSPIALPAGTGASAITAIRATWAPGRISAKPSCVGARPCSNGWPMTT